MKMLVTFGQSHVHRVNGRTFDCNCVARITAPTYEEARARAFEIFGRKFCFTHREEDYLDNLHYYPRGIIDVS